MTTILELTDQIESAKRELRPLREQQEAITKVLEEIGPYAQDGNPVDQRNVVYFTKLRDKIAERATTIERQIEELKVAKNRLVRGRG